MEEPLKKNGKVSMAVMTSFPAVLFVDFMKAHSLCEEDFFPLQQQQSIKDIKQATCCDFWDVPAKHSTSCRVQYG